MSEDRRNESYRRIADRGRVLPPAPPVRRGQNVDLRGDSYQREVNRRRETTVETPAPQPQSAQPPAPSLESTREPIGPVQGPQNRLETAEKQEFRADARIAVAQSQQLRNELNNPAPAREAPRVIIEQRRELQTRPEPQTPAEKRRAEALELETEVVREQARTDSLAPTNTLGQFGKATLFFLPGAAKESIRATVNILNPNPEKNTLFQGVKGFIQSARQGTIIEDATQPFRTNPARATAQLTTDAATGAAADAGVRAAIRTGTNQFIKLGAKEVPAAERFGDVKATSTADSLERFARSKDAEGRQIVVTASPERLSGAAGEGRRGGLPNPIEDPGIYTAPLDSSNPMFLRLQNERSGVTFTLNPLDNLKPRVPTLTEFEVKGVQQQPRSIINQPGFDASKNFLAGEAGSGTAFITKRSEVGQGTAPTSTIKITEDFTTPTPEIIIRDGRTLRTTELRRGDLMQTKGTSEIEAVIPAGTEFRTAPLQGFLANVKGFDRYTIVDGQPVAIRRVQIIDNPQAGSILNQPTATRTQTAELTRTIQREASTLSSDLDRRARIRPTPIIPSNTAPPGSAFSNTPSPRTANTQSSPSAASSSEPPAGTAFSNSPTPSSARSAQRSSGSRSGGSSGAGASPFSGNPSTPGPTPPSPTPSSPTPSSPGRSAGSSGAGASPYSGNQAFSAPQPFTQPTRPTKTKRVAKKEEEPGFSVFVRRKGVFKKVNDLSLSQSDALNLGASIASNTAARSFKIEADNRAAARKNSGAPDLSDFYRSNKETGVFIQKGQKAISSAGELREITQKGIAATKRRK